MFAGIIPWVVLVQDVTYVHGAEEDVFFCNVTVKEVYVVVYLDCALAMQYSVPFSFVIPAEKILMYV